MKYDFSMYKDYFHLILYLILAAATPVIATVVIPHMNPVVL